MNKILSFLITLCIFNLNAQISYGEINAKFKSKTVYNSNITKDGEERNNDFFEGFNTWPPVNWTITATENTEGWNITDYRPYEGDSCMCHMPEITDCNNWLISPEITVPENGILSFQNKNEGTDMFPGDHIVCYSTEGNDPTINTFITLENLNYSEKNWTAHTYDLKDLAGEKIYIGFNYKGKTKDLWLLDNLKVKPKAEFDIEILNIETEGFVLSGKDAIFVVEVKNIGLNTMTDASIKVTAGEYSSTTLVGDLKSDSSRMLEIIFPAVSSETEYTATIESASDSYINNNTKTIKVQAVVDPIYGFNFNSNPSFNVANNFIVFDKNNPKTIFTISSENTDKVDASVKVDDFMYFNSVTMTSDTVIEPKNFGKINLNTGETTIISQSKISFKGLAHNPVDNSVYGIGINTEEENAVMSLYKINLETGKTTKIASNDMAKYTICFAIDNEGVGYVLDGGGNLRYTTLHDFKLHYISGMAEPPSYLTQSMAFDHETNCLFLSKVAMVCYTQLTSLSKIDRATGAETIVKDFFNFIQITGLSFSNTTSKITYAEGFNEWPLDKWEIVRKDVTTTPSWVHDTTNFSEGTSSICHKNGNGSEKTAIDWLISPQIEIGANMEINFDEFNQNMAHIEAHELLISKESGNPEDNKFVVVKSFNESSNGWKKRVIALDEYVGEKIYVAFRYTGNATNWFIDNVIIKQKVAKEIAVLDCNIPEFSSVEKDLMCTVTVKNYGTEEITDTDINLIIGNNSFSKKVTLEPGSTKEVEITTFNFKKNKYLISAFVELEGDQNAQNNTIIYNAYVQDPISDAYGYVIYSNNDELKKGPVKFNPQTAVNINNMDSISSNGIYPYAGTMINNIWYCNYQLYTGLEREHSRVDNTNKDNNPLMWAAIDLTTGRMLNTGNSDKIFTEMSYNHKDKKVYAITTRKNDNKVIVSDLYTVNPSNGKYKLIGECPMNILAFAINKYGGAYIICEDKNLYTINLENLNTSLIGNTGVQYIQHIQSMAFEHSTGRLFWNQQGNLSTIYLVSTENGNAVRISDRKGNAEISAFAFPYGDPLHTVTFNIKKNDLAVEEAKITIGETEKSTNNEGQITFLPFTKDVEIEYSYKDKEDTKTEKITIDKDLFIEIVLTDIEDFSTQNIKIYPNPSNGRINITNLANNTITVLDMQGKVASSIDITSNDQTIDLSDLNNGMYILKTIVNETVLTSKITINK
ncbi:MAG: choice-of-anchor J domain-containing protein [Hyphomicrobiales bacterium]